MSHMLWGDEQSPVKEVGWSVEVIFPGDPDDVAWVHISVAPLYAGGYEHCREEHIATYCRDGGKWEQVVGCDYPLITDQVLNYLAYGPSEAIRAIQGPRRVK